MVYQTQKYAKTMAKAFRGMTNCLSRLTFCHTAMTSRAIFLAHRAVVAVSLLHFPMFCNNETETSLLTK